MVVVVNRILVSAACLQEPSPSPSPSPSNNARTDGEEEVGIACENGSGATKDGALDGRSGGGIHFSVNQVKGFVSECRICQEEEDDKDLESPCACSGTLKFAHRKCVQRWCNKKGDITCEICNQVFSPNYACPPPRRNADVMTIDIRQAWEAHIDLQHPRLLALTEAEHQFLQSEYNDYGVENSRTFAFVRFFAITLMLLLLIHQTFMVKLDTRMPQEPSVFFHYQPFILQLAGFLLPCYFIARFWYTVHCRRRRQG